MRITTINLPLPPPPKPKVKITIEMEDDERIHIIAILRKVVTPIGLSQTVTLTNGDKSLLSEIHNGMVRA